MRHSFAADRNQRGQMAKDYLTPEEGAELERLRAAYSEATARAAAAIVAHSMSSAEFLSADAEAGRITRQIKTLLGLN
jgi:hypothetical protein